MKQKRNGWPLALLAAFVLSCANPVYVERDESANLAKYKTYAWVDMRAKENDTKNVTGLAGDVVRESARKVLEQKGWKETTSNPDVLLSYDVLVERGTQQQSDPVYSRPFSRVYYNPYYGRWATVYYPSQFVGYDTYTVPVKEGTLTLTMTDAHTDKTVWQGWTTETITDSKFTSRDAEKAVKQILKKLE